MDVAKQKLTMKNAFFGAAVCTLASSGTTWIYIFFSFTWAPVSFLAQTFFLLFSLIMVALDLPPLLVSYRAVTTIKMSTHKCLLFLTRVTGRGMVYVFLSTMVFSTMWDNLSMTPGILFALPVLGVGIAGTYHGLDLSTKLNKVRTRLSAQPDRCPYSREVFSQMCAEEDANFSAAELDCVMIAISETMTSDVDNQHVDHQQDFQNWLHGGWLMV